MVSKGFATVLRYRQDDDQRSSHYDELLAAELKAVKSGAGVHAKKNIPTHRVADVAGVRFIQYSFLNNSKDHFIVTRIVKNTAFVNLNINSKTP